MAWDRVPRIEVVAGRYGFFNILNYNQVPLGGLVTLRNATLGDRAWRTGGGASTVGSPITGAPRSYAALDYWPTLTQQRTVVCDQNGVIWKDDGAGGSWTKLKTLASASGIVPTFAVAGQEAAGDNRKLFYADRVNVPQFLDGDGAATAALSAANVDWAGHPPGWFAPHQSYNWGGGNDNAPHDVYRSLATDHGNFNGTPFRIKCGPLSTQERTVGAISYKGGLLVFCFPVGVYFIDTTTDPSPANWFAALVAVPGAAGPRAFAQAEEDIVYVSVDGSWHSLSSIFGQQKASIRASDISYKALTSWAKDNVTLAQLPQADLIYYDGRQELMLAHAPIGSNNKTRRLHVDLINAKETGINWILWDRDDNDALFLRKINTTQRLPAMIDSTGQLWMLDQANRNKGGLGYTFEFMMADTDFSASAPGWAGRRKNARFLQIEYVATGAFTITIEVYMDGALVQTISVTVSGGNLTLPFTLPATLGGLPIKVTPYQRLVGQFKRIAIRGYVTTVNADCVITKLILGAELSAS